MVVYSLVSFRAAALLVLPAFAVHVLEEAPSFTRWVNGHASKEFTQGDFVRNNAAGLATGILGCAVLAQFPGRTIVLLFFLGVVAQLFFNVSFHVWATFAFRTYSPGLWTSVPRYPPLSFYLVALAIRERLMDAWSLTAVVVIGGALHAYFVNRQVFHARPI